MKEFFIIPQGEVARRLEKFRVPVFFLIFLYLLIPIFVYIYMWVSHGFGIPSTILVLMWIAWSIYAWMYISLDVSEHSNVVSLLISFPIIVPFLLFTTILIKYLMKKYPNSDNPDEILKFKRKSKIKSIL